MTGLCRKPRSISLPPPLPPQLLPPVQPLADLPLEAAIHRPVEALPPELLWPVILPREGVRLVVVVGVALAVADLLHELGRRVEDGLGRHEGAVLLGDPHGRLVGGV